ncbi:2',3'-cyclic-nucleotide 3'-phosphodiesterase-like [Megalops cyprinoides]|uniref:2',3'-cyclic-nucleotide 3'-phosphodiesterase-like n=1 Tax=Megalops cyprinoides TaxID=118141 RepID=UPI00186423A8|nr:2',3'-cyclic-nucleotide 3'-phosphodiesterase-like [Megalops cyprinoides]
MEEQEVEQICKQPEPAPDTQELQQQKPEGEKQEVMEPQVQVVSEKVVQPESERPEQAKAEVQEQAEPEAEKEVQVQAEEPSVKAEAVPVQAEEPSVKVEAVPVQPEEPSVKVEVAPVQAEEPSVKVEAGPVEPEEPSVKVEAVPVQAEEPSVKVEAVPVQAEEPSVQTKEPEKVAEPEPEKPQQQQEPEPKKPVQSEQLLEQKAEPLEQAASGEKPEQQPESEKASEPEKSSEAVAEQQPEGEVKKAEPEAVKEEEQKDQAPEATPAPSIAPGSLSFAFLEEEHTKMALLTSHTLFILRGLPGSGKSRLAAAISDFYKDVCTVISADDHNVKPEKLSASADGLKALDKAVVECCSPGKAVIVIDDTNHTHSRLARLEELAEEHQYLVLILEPRTEWCRDVEQLAKKTKRGLDKSQIQALKGPLEETSLPFYFGWFLSPTFKDKLKGMAEDLLKTLGTLDAFKKHLADFTGEAEKEVNLEQYFQQTGPLHCTTKFCDFGKAEGAKEYAEKPSVKEWYGRMTELTLSALFITPRTLGARVALTQEQLELWPADAKAESEPDLPAGSRAHVTLGCAEGVEPVQTGLDLLEIIQLQQQGQEGEKVQDLELGPLAYYGKGIWVLSLSEPSLVPALFSSYYGPKKGEELKKKKPKCTIL